MQLVYITHNSIFNLHALAPALSWPLVIGAGYGAVSLVGDVARFIIREVRG